MDWIALITSVTTVIAGGGWFINWRANRKKANAEADSAAVAAMKEAQSGMQEVLKEMRAMNDTLQNVNQKNEDALTEKDKQIETLTERDTRHREEIATLKMMLCRHDACPLREPLKGQGGEWFEKHKSEADLADTESIYIIAKKKGFLFKRLPVKDDKKSNDK